MAHLEPTLTRKLGDLRVRIDAPDGDTLILRDVPADERSFSKARTNLLVKRPRKGMPFLICVDEDLRYTGSDQMLARAFAAGVLSQGWRVLSVGGSLQRDPEEAVRKALGVLGLEGAELTPGAPGLYPAGGTLAACATPLSRQVREGSAQVTVGRREQVEQAAACALSWQGRVPIIVGAPGVGKTNLLHGVARRLGEARPELEVVLVNLDVLMAGTVLEGERENLLAALLKDALTASVVVAAEHVEFVLWRMARGPALLCDALDGGLRLIATALPQSRERFDVYPLTRRFELIELSELSTDDSMRALEGVRQRIAAHHGVGVDPDMVKTAVDRSISLAGCLPAKAIALLDAAASRAALARSPAVAVLDVYLAAAAMPEA